MAPVDRTLHHQHDKEFLLGPNAAQTTLAATAWLAGRDAAAGGGSAQIDVIGVTPGSPAPAEAGVPGGTQPREIPFRLCDAGTSPA